jgi:hypothetical protein
MSGLIVPGDLVITTHQHVTDAFTEWDYRFRHDPDAFQSTVSRILSGESPHTYGQACAPYFVNLLRGAGPLPDLVQAEGPIEEKRVSLELRGRLQQLVDEYGFAGVNQVLNDHESIRF